MFVVFDLDGTLSCDAHRAHLVRRLDPDHRAFYEACGADAPKWPAIKTLKAHAAAGHRVEIWSGRSSAVRDRTEAWFMCFGLDAALLTRMRPAGDDRPAIELKAEWLADAAASPGGPPALAYDDSASAAAMWRAAGVTCFQVDAGSSAS